MPYNNPPWHPIKEAIHLKHLGKLGEECGELSAIISRCIIQGMMGLNPETGRPNIENLQEEIADVRANIELVIEHFKLEESVINPRVQSKKSKLRMWHKGA